MANSFTAMFAHIIHRGLRALPLDPVAARRAIRRFDLGTLAYPGATAAGLVWPPAILIAIGALATYYAFEQAATEPSQAG